MAQEHPSTTMSDSRPEEVVVANRYNFRVVTNGQGLVSVSEIPTWMVPGPQHRAHPTAPTSVTLPSCAFTARTPHPPPPPRTELPSPTHHDLHSAAVMRVPTVHRRKPAGRPVGVS